MKYVVGIILLVVAAGLLFFATGSGSQSAETVNSRSSPDFKTEVQSGTKLVDVRTPEEFAAGHIEGSVNLPLANIQNGELPQVSSKTDKIYVYCRSGNRSAQAKSLLVEAGYTNIVDLGAMSQVVSMGGKEVK